jgi:hypothetical protein
MAEEKAARPAKQPDPPPVLGVAAESTDPVVHQLLAAREIADRNGDEAAVKAVDAKLAEFGVK